MRGDSGAAFGADEQRAGFGQIEGAERDVIGDQLCDLRQQRHHALFAALADHRERVAARRNRRA